MSHPLVKVDAPTGTWKRWQADVTAVVVRHADTCSRHGRTLGCGPSASSARAHTTYHLPHTYHTRSRRMGSGDAFVRGLAWLGCRCALQRAGWRSQGSLAKAVKLPKDPRIYIHWLRACRCCCCCCCCCCCSAGRFPFVAAHGAGDGVPGRDRRPSPPTVRPPVGPLKAVFTAWGCPPPCVLRCHVPCCLQERCRGVASV